MSPKKIGLSQTGLKFLDLFFEAAKLLAHFRSLLHRHGDAICLFGRARRIAVVVLAVRNGSVDPGFTAETTAGAEVSMVSDSDLAAATHVVSGRHRASQTDL